MIRQHCPRCRLAIAVRAENLMVTNCPRCLARAATPVTMSVLPAGAPEGRAVEHGSRLPPR
ncbi:MAG: hypothetical protein ACR2KV_00440 [Solirubrobacteraceae bacterium]